MVLQFGWEERINPYNNSMIVSGNNDQDLSVLTGLGGGDSDSQSMFRVI